MRRQSPPTTCCLSNRWNARRALCTWRRSLVVLDDRAALTARGQGASRDAPRVTSSSRGWAEEGRRRLSDDSAARGNSDPGDGGREAGWLAGWPAGPDKRRGGSKKKDRAARQPNRQTGPKESHTNGGWLGVLGVPGGPGGPKATRSSSRGGLWDGVDVWTPRQAHTLNTLAASHLFACQMLSSARARGGRTRGKPLVMTRAPQ